MGDADLSFQGTGLLIDTDDIQRVRSQLTQVDAPEQETLALLRDQRMAWLAHEPAPVAEFLPLVHHFQPGHPQQCKRDFEAAYGLSLLALFTDDTDAGMHAARILDAWSHTLQSIQVDDLGKVGYLYTSYLWPAAVWTSQHLQDAGIHHDRERFQQLLQRLILPICRPTLYRNNWTCWAICCHMAIAVHLQEATLFAEAIARWKDLLDEYISRPSGHTKETLRDLVHAQMGLVALTLSAEMAWKQGIDLYGFAENRLLAAVELHGPWALGDLHDWPYEKPAKDVGFVWPFYELARHHYGRRCGLPTPRIDHVLEQLEPQGFDRMGYFGLSHRSL
jgi:hypothetical protein